MFGQQAPKTGLRTGFDLLSLIYHNTVRTIRSNHGNAIVGLLLNMVQAVVLVMAIYVMFSVLGLRGMALRGDFLLYIMSGIFLFMTHTKALSAVAGSEGPTSAMMKHAPMNTAIAIASAALAALYLQILSIMAILAIYHAAFTPISIADPIGAMAMLLLSWGSGVGIGMLFLAVKPWFPTFTSVGSTVYARVNMIASGKMFVANTLPSNRLKLFDWNPLFHTIDQARGYTFINYNPHYTSTLYPLYVMLACLMIGLMGEFYTRRNASLSWNAGR